MKHHIFRIEWQQRGSPHPHCALWVKGSRIVNSPEYKLPIVDQYVSSSHRKSENIVLFPRQFSKLGCWKSAVKANIMQALCVEENLLHIYGHPQNSTSAYTRRSFWSDGRQIWMCSFCAMSMLVCITVSPITLKMREKCAYPMWSSTR